MKYLLVFFSLTTVNFAGLETLKKNYEKKLAAIRRQYVHDLKKEKQRLMMRGKPVDAIQREIEKVSAIVKPVEGTFRVKYTTGIRMYRFSAGKVFFDQDKENAAYKRDGDKITFTWPSRSYEVWTEHAEGWEVVFYASDGRKIKGFAILFRK